MSNIFESSLKDLKERIGTMEINANTIVTVLRFAMEVVESTQLKGEAQKTLVIKLVKQVVVDAPISDDKEKFLLDLVDNGIIGEMTELVDEFFEHPSDIFVDCCLSEKVFAGLDSKNQSFLAPSPSVDVQESECQYM